MDVDGKTGVAGPKLLFTVPEIARACEVSDRTIRRAIAAGELRYIRFGRKLIRIRLADAQDYIEQRLISTREAAP